MCYLAYEAVLLLKFSRERPIKSLHMDLIPSCQSALSYYGSYFSKCWLYIDARYTSASFDHNSTIKKYSKFTFMFYKRDPKFQMMNNKCHNWVRLKTPSTLQSIGMNKKSMMGQVVCAVSQSVNLSCFKAQTCERSAAPTLLGVQDPVAATTSAARIRGIHLRSVFLISSHPSLPVTVNAATF